MAKYLCKYCLHHSVFLDFKPSQIASTCFLLALNALSQKSSIEIGSFETCSEIDDAEEADVQMTELVETKKCSESPGE